MKTHPVICVMMLTCWFATFANLTLAQDAGESHETQHPISPSPGDVNRKASRVYTFVDKTGLGHQHAIEGTLASGSLIVGAEADAGRLVFDMRSFDSDTANARRYIGLAGTTSESTRSQVNDNMRGSHVLDVQRYPTAIFDVDTAMATGKTSKRGRPTYELAGTFTLHGISKPIRVNASRWRRFRSVSSCQPVGQLSQCLPKGRDAIRCNRC